MNIFSERAREYWLKAWRLVRVSKGKISDWTICQAGVPWRFARAAVCLYEINTRRDLTQITDAKKRILFHTLEILAPKMKPLFRGVYYNL